VTYFLNITITIDTHCVDIKTNTVTYCLHIAECRLRLVLDAVVNGLDPRRPATQAEHQLHGCRGGILYRGTRVPVDPSSRLRHLAQHVYT
jgi:hypothetical protein